MKRWMLATLVLLLALTACQPPDTEETARPELVTPVVDLRGTEAGRLEIRLGVANDSDQSLAEDENFDGRWQLIDIDGEIRAEGRLYHLGPLDAEELRYPMSWAGEVETDSYSLLWGAPSIGHVVAEFEVSATDGEVMIQSVTQESSDVFPPEGGYVVP